MVVTKRCARPATYSKTRPNKLAKVSPSAKYVIWCRNAYPRDGFHSYAGPGEREVLAAFEDKAEANEAAKLLFFKKNPWGVSREDVGEPDARMKDGKLYLWSVAGDSEVWEVCVSDRECLEKWLKKEDSRWEEEEDHVEEEYDTDSEYEDHETLYGPMVQVTIDDDIDGPNDSDKDDEESDEENSEEEDEDEEEYSDEEVHTGGVQLTDIIAGGVVVIDSDDGEEFDEEFSSDFSGEEEEEDDSDLQDLLDQEDDEEEEDDEE